MAGKGPDRTPEADFDFWQGVMEGNESLVPNHPTTRHPASRRWNSAPRDLRIHQPQSNPLHIRKVDPETFDW